MLSPLLSSHWDRSQHLLEIQLLVCKTYRAQLDLEDVGVQCRCSVFKTSPELGVIQTWTGEGLGKLTLWLPSRQRLFPGDVEQIPPRPKHSILQGMFKKEGK